MSLAPRDRIRASFPKPEATLDSALSIPEQRAAWEQHMEAGRKPSPDITTHEVRFPVPGVMVSPADSVDLPLILYAHGGGFVMGSPKTHLGLAIELSRAARSRVLLVDYRRAPEHEFPAARDDFIAAYRAASAAGESPRRIAFAGDSAGGHIVMTSILRLHEAGVQLPGAVVLLSPWLDLAQRGPTMRTKATVDPLLLERDLRDCARMYLGVNSPLSPAVDVLAADPRVFPPLLMHVGTDEILLSDAARLADATASAGGSVELKIWPDLWHVFQMWTPQLPEANEAITQIGNFVRARLGYIPAAR